MLYASYPKHTRSSFPERKMHASRPLELVHADLIGAIDPTSIGGSRYALTFTDDYSRWKTVYFLHHKSEAITKLKAYLLDMKGLLGNSYSVRRIHSDGGGEFIGDDFKLYCKTQGILTTTSAPRTPEQNGMAERTNRTIVEMARCLRLQSGIGKEMWTYACETAVYLLNRLPTSVLEGATPYHRLFGKHARMDHLKTFGCEAYVHVYDHQRKKFDEKAWQGILVGYDMHNNKSYRIFDPIKLKTYMSAHVTFNEEVFPGQRDGDQPDAEPKIVQRRTTADPEPEHNDQPYAEPKVVQRRVTVDPQPHVIAETNAETQGETAQPPAENIDSVGDNDSTVNNESSTDSNPTAFHWTTPFCTDTACTDRSVHYAHLGIHYAYLIANDILGDPRSYREAMRSKFVDQWRKAMKEEYDSLIRHRVFVLVPKPPDVNIVGTRWVFKTKRDEHGNIVRYRARTVAQGYSQAYGIDFWEIYSPVPRWVTILLILAIAAMLNYEVHNMDVETAFLNSDIKEVIYLKQPEGFEQAGPNGEELVCLLQKSIYGLKQASRNWNDTINHWLTLDSVSYTHLTLPTKRIV